MADSQLLPASLSLESLRDRFPGYNVVRQVGHGAMGVVYEATQAGIGRRVALKVLPPNLALRERTVKRFLREAEAMGKLAHPSIVDVYEVGSKRDLHFFSMKFVDGPPLDRVLKAGPLAVEDVILIGISVSSALAHAHSRGVLHRDVKPSNLLRDEERVVLTDFGLARPVDSSDGGSMTESGDLVGTPLYMSPEQISGDAERIDGRADAWGLGVTLYELLTQRTPFTGPNAQGILHSILHKDPPLLHKLRDDIPRDLEAVILKCLEKDPERRYSTAAALRDDLEAVRDGQAVSASRPRLYDPCLRWVRRHRGEALAIGVIGLVAVTLMVGWLGATRLLEDVSAERDTAQQQRSQAIQGQKAEFRQKAISWALVELSELRTRAISAPNEADREEAEQRMIDLIELARAIDPDFAATGMEMLFSLLHERRIAQAEAMATLEEMVRGYDPMEQLELRAAALTGIERYAEALEMHRRRLLLDPTDPRPRLDAARTLRRTAQFAREEGLMARSRADLTRALVMLGPAQEHAIARRDSAAVVAILIERGRCHLDLDDPGSARAELDMAYRHDETSMEARALLLTCDRQLQSKPGQPGAQPQPAVAGPTVAPLAADAEDEEQPALTVEALLPRGSDLTDELQTAGRGFRSIYRGVKSLLNDQPDEQAPEASAPEASAPATTPAPGPQGKPPDPGRPPGQGRT